MTSASGNHRSYVPTFKVNDQTRDENGRSKARIAAQLITDLSPRAANKYHLSIIAYIQRDVNICQYKSIDYIYDLKAYEITCIYEYIHMYMYIVHIQLLKL
jgi:hypothetical protein